MKKRINRRAFTMLELIFVIVIMAILGKFGTEFLAKAYESFIFSKINNELQARSASAVEIISKKLEYRIKQSVIARNTTDSTYNYVNNTGLSDSNATVLEWISTDTEGFRSGFWSGVIDLSASNASRLISPRTDLNKTSTQISVLSPSGANIDDAAIYFINSYLSMNPWGYDGKITTQGETLHPIKRLAGSENQLHPAVATFAGTEVFEFYKLSWTAYAIELKDYNETTHLGNLVLYYDYRPWLGETYDQNGTVALLAEDINTFRFRSAGSLLKIQVCVKSNLPNEEYALCKEKTVY
jgi:prepilin-type N-terminal cleavage/methylation domain-containing protein